MHEASSSLVTVARYTSKGDARLAKTQLEDAGIPCMLSNEDQSGLATVFDPAEGGVQVKVSEDRASEAQAVLDPDPDD